MELTKFQIPSFEGIHNTDLDTSRERLLKGQTYKDLSTIIIVPVVERIFERTRDDKLIEVKLTGIPYKVVQSWVSMITPMNQKMIRSFVPNMEVGEAYSNTIEGILANPELSTWKYILTLETDNMPPPDGLIKLYETIEKFDAVGGLYWTKGELGQPMIYGDVDAVPISFAPQVPRPNSLQPCRGLGMGFTMFRIEMFKDKRLPKPLFKTLSEYAPGVGSKLATQDLYFFEAAGKLGYKFACDTRVKVGHYDVTNDIVW
jgi:hypothetical protein